MTFRILSIDGGGIRGVVPAVILEEVEQQIGQPLNQYFHLIAGTSTGSILAAAVATGRKSREILQLYRDQGPVIFPYTSLFSWRRLPLLLSYGLSAPKFSDKNLTQVLIQKFSNQKLHEVESPKLLITAYDTISRSPLIFKSWRTDKPYQSVPLWEACVCSSSAPTYFPAHPLELQQKGTAQSGSVNTIALATNASQNPDDYINMQIEIIGGTGRGQTNIIRDYDGANYRATVEKAWDTVPDHTSIYSVTVKYLAIDGGVGANNPSACALAEGIRLRRESAEAQLAVSEPTQPIKELIDDITVLSIGTGDVQSPVQSGNERGWGLLKWILTGRLIQVLFDASSGVDDYISAQVLSVLKNTEKPRYLRLQPPIANDRIDDASRQNVDNLIQQAQNYINANKDSMSNFLRNN